VPALDLCVPTLHAMHTPALAPPQPLRTSPAAAQLLHAEQSLAPAASLKVSAGHASQCVPAPVRGGAAPPLPRSPAAHASQRVWPPSAWYLPSGHASQPPALLVLENVPGAHGAQTRFDVAFGAADSCAPAAHTA
jgi:hypothetical protein